MQKRREKELPRRISKFGFLHKCLNSGSCQTCSLYFCPSLAIFLAHKNRSTDKINFLKEHSYLLILSSENSWVLELQLNLQFSICHFESYSWIVSSCFTASTPKVMNFFRSYYLLQKEQNAICFAIIYLIEMCPMLMSWEKMIAGFSVKSRTG